MRVLYSPQVNDVDSLLYTFDNDIITVDYNGIEEVYDFSQLKNDGVATDIESDLPISPVISAKRENGILMVNILKFIGEDATEQEKFPDWIDVDGTI